MTGRITQADIARRAGVHFTTVSLALRNHPSLPLSTRRRLQALADEMGYRPDPQLRALVAYRQRQRPAGEAATLAYLTHWSTRWGWKQSPAHAEFHAGAAGRAAALGYALDHFWLGEKGLSPRALSRMLQSRGITGVVVASHDPARESELQLEWERFCAVKIDFFPHLPRLHTVTNDQRAIIQLAVQRVAAAAYRRVGFVMPRWWDRFVDQAWSAGFLAAQQNLPACDHVPILAYSSPEPSRVAPGDHSPVPTRELEAWLARYRPEAIVSWGPFVRPRLSALGIRVPRDLAYVDIFRTDTEPGIAGIRQNCRRVGELAIELLAGQLMQYSFGVPEFPTTTLVEGTWFDGDSLPLRRPSQQSVRSADL